MFGWFVLLLLVCILVYAVKGTAAEWSWGKVGCTVWLVPWLLSHCRQYNPLLTWPQEVQLVQIFKRILLAWEDGKPVIPLLRAAVALAVPNAYLAMTLVERLHNNLNSPQQQPTIQTFLRKDTDIDRQLMKMYGYDGRSDGRRFSERTKRGLLSELATNPSCPITLEPILDSSQKLTPDVAMLVQENRNSQTDHVFLFRRQALEQWFQNGSQTNPLTRQQIDPSREFFILS